MKLLISGATGFIGQNLIERLVTEGHEITVLVRSTSRDTNLTTTCKTYCCDNPESLITLFEKEHFSGVVHLATHFLSEHKHNEITNLIEANVLLGTRIIDAAARANTPWFINIGTFTQHFKNAQYAATNLYSATKQAFEDIACFYAETGKIRVITLKLFDTFGINDRRKKLVNLLKQSADEEIPLNMSPGEQILDISPIDNVIDGLEQLIAMMEHDSHLGENHYAFALPSNERMTLRAFVDLFGKAYGKTPRVNFGARPYREREIMEPWTDCIPLPGWKPKKKLGEAIFELRDKTS